jgi:sulfite reductase (NADPH) flavoprotein alpha-component
MIVIHILWGSQTGNARNLAHLIADHLVEEHQVIIHDMSDLPPEDIFNIKNLIIVTSTYGDGEAPDNASEWMSYLKFSENLNLSHLRYAVIGLGDSYYPHFCQAGKDFDQYLSKHGAHAMLHRLDCDGNADELYLEWANEFKNVLKESLSD